MKRNQYKDNFSLFSSRSDSNAIFSVSLFLIPIIWCDLYHTECSVSTSLLTHELDQQYSIWGTKSNDGFKIFRKILQNFEYRH